MILDRHTVVSDPTTLVLEPGTTISVTDRSDSIVTGYPGDSGHQ